MRLEIIGNTLEEDLLAQVCAQHANDRTTFKVTDVVEDLIDLQTIENGDLDGVGGSQSVECEGLLNRISLHKCQRVIENEYL